MIIKFGAIVVDGRGKLGGHVFSKNRSGAYMRTKVTPTNPQTSSQTAVRNLFGSLSQAWSGLTQPIRNGWDGAVTAWQDTNIFGDIRIPTGKNLYLRLNNTAQSVGWPAIPTAPAKAEMPSEVITSSTYAVGAETITLVGANTTADVRYQCWATAPLSQGTTFVSNRLRVIDSFLASTSSPADLGAAYVAKFGPGVAGDNIYFAYAKVLANGQSSPLQIIKGVVIA